MLITFWGVRGSVPSPGPNTIYYGGNTTCLTVETEKSFLIIDAGTGIINVGPYVKKKKIKTMHVLFTHYHWDHLQGLPFFSPIFNSDIHIDMYGKKNLGKILALQMTQPFFPADYRTLPSQIMHKKFTEKFEIDDITVSTIDNNHPNGCTGLRLSRNGKSFVFMTDNELFSPTDSVTTRDQFLEFIMDCDYLVHDAQYNDEEIKKRAGWGHSTFNQAIQLGMEGNARNIILTHHDPMRKDRELKQIVNDLREAFNTTRISAAREFLSFEL